MWILWMILLIVGYFLPDFQRGKKQAGKHWFGVQFSEKQQLNAQVQAVLKKAIKDFRRAYLFGFILIPIVSVLVKPTPEGFGIIYWILLLWGLQIYFHRRLKQMKLGLPTDPEIKIVRTADLAPRPTLPRNIHLGFWLAMAIAAATWILLILNYDALPNPLPVHWDLMGQPNDFVEKTPFAVHQNAGLILILVAIFYFFSNKHYQAKRLIDPARPKTAVIRYQIARDRMSLYMVLLANLVAILLAVVQLGAIWALPQWLYPASSIATFIIAFGGIAIYYATTGDHGQRLTIMAEEPVNKNLVSPDEDQYWKGGLFYYNPNDPTLWVPKRFSGGYTVNAGHPVGKLIYIGLVILLLSFLLF
ncbi:DUF5808 domain-containing protein [Gottschalkiaceae bacterium SANA]|nr:DUF5808 domain-containing protein [Gottschalkiaceae bacterium SANA]